jgi:hypothetical protein
MSPIELLIEDNNNTNKISNRKESSSVPINAAENTSSIDNHTQAIITTSNNNNNDDNENDNNNLIKKMSSITNYDIVVDDETEEGSGDGDKYQKENCQEQSSIITSPIESCHAKEDEEVEETEINDSHSLDDENGSSYSLSTTSSMSPMSDSTTNSTCPTKNKPVNTIIIDSAEIQLPQSDTSETNPATSAADNNNINNIPESLTDYQYDANEEVEAALNANISMPPSTNTTSIPEPPNSLALQTNLNDVILESPTVTYDQYSPIAHSNPQLATAAVGNLPPVYLQSLPPNPSSACNPYPILTQLPAHQAHSHSHHHPHHSISHIHHPMASQSTYLYPTAAPTNHLNSTAAAAAYINSNYNHYYNNGHYLVQQANRQTTITSPCSSDLTTSHSSSSSTPISKQNMPFSESLSNSANTLTNSSTIFVHIEAGHAFRVQLGDEIREILGPATVKMVSNDGSQPVPIQLTTPSPGQLVQQIVDENGVLTHLILSSSSTQTQQQQTPVMSPLSNESLLVKPPVASSPTNPANPTSSKTAQLHSAANSSTSTKNSPSNAVSTLFLFFSLHVHIAPLFYSFIFKFK